jgi:hypothetical protein
MLFWTFSGVSGRDETARQIAAIDSIRVKWPRFNKLMPSGIALVDLNYLPINTDFRADCETIFDCREIAGNLARVEPILVLGQERYQSKFRLNRLV